MPTRRGVRARRADRRRQDFPVEPAFSLDSSRWGCGTLAEDAAFWPRTQTIRGVGGIRMRRVAIGWLLGVVLAGIALAGAGVAAEDEKAGAGQVVGPSGTTPPAVSSAPPPLYQLPKVGKPRGRIGGGRRGAMGAVAELQALVPDHVGQTASAQPSLYWYLAQPAGDVAFELTLIDGSSVDPLVDVRLDKPSAGLQRVRLADLGVELKPGQEYQWSVAAVPDPEDHSKDVVASGWIERVAAPDDMQARLRAAGPDGAASVYGAAGLWYETLDAACERVRQNPDSDADRQRLAALLEQVGLPPAAAERPRP